MWISRYWVSLPVSFIVLGILVGSTPLVGLGVILLLAGVVARY